MAKRRVFTAEFKREAMRLVRERGMPVTRAAEQLEVHENVLRKWVRAIRLDGEQPSPGQGRLKPEQAEIERLRREVAQLKREREILKKAAAY